MPITFPSGTEDTIDEIRSVIGRDVTFNVIERTTCSGCSIDPITDTSTDPFCVICSGVGYIVTFSGLTLIAHITHDPQSTHWLPGGTIPMGDCRVQIKYSSSNLATVESSNHVIVDELKYDVKRITKRGVPTVNRLILDLMRRP